MSKVIKVVKKIQDIRHAHAKYKVFGLFCFFDIGLERFSVIEFQFEIAFSVILHS